MEEDLYDEFGNYIGPAMGSDESEGEDGGAVTSAWMESHVAASADVEMEEAPGVSVCVSVYVRICWCKCVCVLFKYDCVSVHK